MGNREVVKNWPGRDVILRYIKNVRLAIRPPYEDITAEKRDTYHFDQCFYNFQNENILKII